MSKGSAIMVLGFLSAFMPFTGFPTGFAQVLTIVFGIATMALGFLVREERTWLVRAIEGGHKTDAYTENKPSVSNTPSEQ